MRNYKIFAGIFIIICSCQKKLESKISDEQIINILADIHIAESAIALVNPAMKDSIVKGYKSEIFSVYKVDSIEFKQYFETLQADPKRMTLLYEQVLIRLEKLDSH